MAQTLKMHRERRRLSTRELAKMAGIAADTIWRIEGGDFKNVRPVTQRKLAAALQVDPDDISEFRIANEDSPNTEAEDTAIPEIGLVTVPAPTPAQLAEADRRLDRGYRQGFYRANEDGTPADERIQLQPGSAEPVPA